MPARQAPKKPIEKLDENKRFLNDRLPENILSDDGRMMEDVVLKLLQDRGLTLALAESISGGMIGEMLTRVPGSSRTFMGSIVSYSNEMKSGVLGVTEQTLPRNMGRLCTLCSRNGARGPPNW